MKKYLVIGSLIGVLISVLTVLTIVLFVREKSAQGAAPAGLVPTVTYASSTVINNQDVTYIFKKIDNCGSRIITTFSTAHILLNFFTGTTSDPNVGIFASSTNYWSGHVLPVDNVTSGTVAGTSTATFDAAVYGCDAWTARIISGGLSSTTILVTETR